jgi:transcriptional regulator with XRE-family HTH domain
MRQFRAVVIASVASGEIDVRDDGTFSLMLRIAMDHCGLERRKLANELGVATPTISRWANGASLPSRAYRKAIANDLLQIIEDKANATEEILRGSIEDHG